MPWWWLIYTNNQPPLPLPHQTSEGNIPKAGRWEIRAAANTLSRLILTNTKVYALLVAGAGVKNRPTNEAARCLLMVNHFEHGVRVLPERRCCARLRADACRCADVGDCQSGDVVPDCVRMRAVVLTLVTVRH